jgi:hypothetical protein
VIDFFWPILVYRTATYLNSAENLSIREQTAKNDPIESLDQRENRRADREKRTTEILRQWTGNQTVKRPFNLVAGLQLLL